MPLDRIFNIYLLMFFFPLVFMLLRFNQRRVLYLIALVYSVLIGFRYEVGGDWNAYLEMLNMAGNYGFWDYLNLNDKGYMLLNWMAYHYGGGIYLVNFICALLFMYGLVRFVKLEPNPLLALLVAVPYLVVVVAMGYTRQSVAIGFVFLALSFYYERRLFWVVLSLTLATFFHKTAIVAFLPLLLLPKDIVSTKNKLLIAGWTAILFYFLVVPSFNRMLYVYVGKIEPFMDGSDLLVEQPIQSPGKKFVESSDNIAESSKPLVESSGGLIRILINIIPAIIFLAFRNRFSVNREIAIIMTLASVFSIILLPVVFKFSTIADRIGLYLTSIQLFVFNRIVDISENNLFRRVLLVGIVLYYLSMLTVWLSFGKHANAWIPYKFALFEIFKQ